MTHSDRLSKSIDRLEHEHAVFLSKFEGLSQVQLDYRTSRNSWSIGQVAHHVGLSEGVWQGYLRSLLKGGNRAKGATLRVSLRDVPFSSRVIPDFILNSPLVVAPITIFINLLPRPVQSMFFAVPLLKMDSGPRMQPKLGMPRAQILKLLSDTRKATLDLLAPVENWDLTHFRIQHPLVGDQDVHGILELLSSHEQRHAQQVDSIKKSLHFPNQEKQAQNQ